MKLLLPFAIIAAPAFAETCPTPVDQSEALNEIVAEYSSASERRARSLSAQLWAIWTDAPDEKSQDMLDEGMRLISVRDFAGSQAILTDLITYCPDFAEGYNQRAFARFLAQDYAAALEDLDQAIVLIPNHIAAISGRGLTLFGLGREEEGQQAIRDALALNPYLSERRYLKEPEGTDI